MNELCTLSTGGVTLVVLQFDLYRMQKVLRITGEFNLFWLENVFVYIIALERVTQRTVQCVVFTYCY